MFESEEFQLSFNERSRRSSTDGSSRKNSIEGSRRNSMELVGTKAGTAMPAEMRQALNLKGLVPASIENFAKQELRAYEQLMTKSTDLEKYEFLAVLRSTHVNLFFRLVIRHFREIAPIIYTPTVGE
ncbi:hypothetical protein H4S06_005332, partial [Coemansia sp. BCRC 34490]